MSILHLVSAPVIGSLTVLLTQVLLTSAVVSIIAQLTTFINDHSPQYQHWSDCSNTADEKLVCLTRSSQQSWLRCHCPRKSVLMITLSICGVHLAGVVQQESAELIITTSADISAAGADSSTASVWVSCRSLASIAVCDEWMMLCTCCCCCCTLFRLNHDFDDH